MVRLKETGQAAGSGGGEKTVAQGPGCPGTEQRPRTAVVPACHLLEHGPWGEHEGS